MMAVDRDTALRARLSALFEIDRHSLTFEAAETVSYTPQTVVERLRFRSSTGDAVRAFLTRPAVCAEPAPAILYIHAHGARHDIGAAELVDGRPALLSPLGPVFAERGFVTLCIDLPCFGDRADESESAAAKAALWRGRSLAGRMLGELHSALDWLASRDDVDAARIGCFGISMGATFGYWLAAVDRRIAALAHLCCYADFATLIETGAHDLHGIYLTVPGLLDVASNGVVAGLIAPRLQLICIGDRDPLTPPQAVDLALAETRAAYARAGALDRLVLLREAETGHTESAAMRASVLDFLARVL